jgi:hypothetical protein
MENKKSTVWITQENNKNYSQAKNYGTPTFVTSFEYSGIANSKINSYILKDIDAMANKFNPETDYLLFTGDPVIIALCVHALLAIHGSVNVLKWQNQDKIYNSIKL